MTILTKICVHVHAYDLHLCCVAYTPTKLAGAVVLGSGLIGLCTP